MFVGRLYENGRFQKNKSYGWRLVGDKVGWWKALQDMKKAVKVHTVMTR